MAFVKDYDHLKIEMKDIVSATNNFDSSKVIGGGGFGRVYKGEISLPTGQTTVAFKKLDRRLGQGNTEFWKEIMMLSKYKHEHLISLMHFCIEGDEMILVYEHAARGSLDRYLSDVTLTWTQRLKICVGAARGLHFLHDPKEKQQRLIHRDIKSGNILLDEKWSAKVSDFGLSKAAPANQPQTYVFSNAVGTPGYCDPVYWETGFLSKESDVYSFGVVLFEVLCGRLCCEYRKGELTNILVPKWRQSYEDKSLEEMIPLGLREQMELHSLNSFSAIAYRCVKKAREERPTMAEIVKELEFALEQQEIFDKFEKRLENFEDVAVRVDLATKVIKIADLPIPPQIYGCHKQLLRFLYKGFFVDDQQAWICMNVNGEVTKVVSATKCFFGEKHEMKAAGTKPTRKSKNVRCKFRYYLWNVYNNHFRVEINTRFLPPHVTYDIYIVFKYCGEGRAPRYTPFEYKLDNETHYSTSCIAYRKQNSEWMMTKLYQFTTHNKQQTFSIQFFPRHQFIHYHEYAFEGIEFRPVEHKTCAEQVTNFKTDAHLETNLETKFADLLKLSKDVIKWKTEMELYSLLRKGFLTIEPEEFQRLHDCSTQPTLGSYHFRLNRLHSQLYDPFLNQKSVPLLWISISKFMKKRVMIPASTFLSKNEWTCNSVADSESRFKVVTKSLIGCWFDIHLEETLNILSPQTTYSCHLIYKLPDNYSAFEGPMVIGITGGSDDGCLFPLSICLNTRCHPPFIGTKDDDCRSLAPLENCEMNGHSKRRKDGWMEIQFAEVKIPTSNTWYRLSVQEEKFENTNFFGIVIEGIEFRAL